MVDIVKDHSQRVKHWETGEMALRWAAREADMYDTGLSSSRHAEIYELIARDPKLQPTLQDVHLIGLSGSTSTAAGQDSATDPPVASNGDGRDRGTSP